MAGKFLNAEETARQLGVSVEEVNRLVDRKKLFPMRDGTVVKFKVEDVDRLVQNPDSSSLSGDLSLDFEPTQTRTPVDPITNAPIGHNLPDDELNDNLLGDPIDGGDSIFFGDPPAGQSASQTIVRKDATVDGSVVGMSQASGLSMPSVSGVAGASAADVILNDSIVGAGDDNDELLLESIVGASSPSLAKRSFGDKASSSSIGNGSALTVDFSDAQSVIAGQGNSANSLVIGSGLGLSGISDATRLGAAVSDVLDQGLSLEDGPFDGGAMSSGVDLGEIDDDAAPVEGATVLGGDEFELGGLGGDDESASVVIATDSESGDSSFFGQVGEGDGSSFSDDSAVSGSLAGFDGGDFVTPNTEMTFSVWQILGLVCCCMTLLACGFVAYDLVRTTGSPVGVTLANPLLNAMAEAFGWL